MAGSKSDRKINATYDIFSTKEGANDAVRVGYIDPKRGYVSGLSVYQANKYAERNPGTQFIITNRDKVRYININEVNKLTNKDTLPAANPEGLVDENGEFDPCNTVKGFKTAKEGSGSEKYAGGPDGEEPVIPDPGDENQISTDGATPSKTSEANYKRYKSELDTCRVKVELQGGGGVGAVATPIVGLDGSILHVRVIHGGFGYKIPPQVRIIDDCKRGSGAKGKSVLGSIGFIEERFDEEADVEDYNFKLGEYDYDPDDNPWGKTYDMGSQSVVGDWNPANFLSLTNASSFQTELNAYLKFLKGYDPNKPWWTTRDETPVNVKGNGTSKKSKKFGTALFPVEHWAWGGEREQDDLFQDVEFEVYGQGTYKNRQIYFQFEAEDGSHQFRVKGITHDARSGKKRTQLVSLKANTTYNVTSNIRKKTVDPGTRKLEQGLIEEAGRRPKEIGGNKAIGQRSKAIFADIIGSANDNDDIQVTANIGSFKAGERTAVKFDTSGIQNKQVRLKKAIDRIQARKLDIKKELAQNGDSRTLKEEHGNLTVELAEKRAEQQELRKKLRDIDKNENNKFKRGTFALTYRLNRRKQITFTEKVEPSFMNRYAVAPQYASDQPGSDKADKPYSLFYKEHFPHDGDYVFKGAADNQGEVFLDGESIMDITDTFNSKPVRVKKHVKEGLHDIRIDLLNFPQKKIIEETYTADGGDKTKIRKVKFNVVGSGSGRHRKIKCVFTNKADASDNFTLDNDGENNEVREVQRNVTAGARYDVKFIATAERRENPNKETIIPIELASPGTKGRGNKARLGKVERKKIKYLDERGDDPNAQLSIDSTSPGLTAKFSDDGSKLITKGSGNITLKFKWDDNPKSAGKAVGQLKVSDKTFKQVGEKGEERQTIFVGNAADGTPLSESTRVHRINFNNLNPNNDPIHVSNIGHKLYLKDSNGKDVNAEVIIEDVKGGTAKFTPNGKGIEVKGDCEVRITLEWDDNPNVAGKALDSFEIGGKVWNQVGKEGTKTQTISLKGTRNLPQSYKSIIEQGCVENGTKNKETKASSSRVFGDYLGSVNDNDDMQIFVEKGGVFTSSNRRRINRDGETDGEKGRGTFDLEYVFDEKTGGLAKELWQDLKDKNIVDDKTGKSLERSDIEKAIVFNTKKFIDKANRKLYRMRPDVGPFGDFFNRDGITPFNPVELDKEIPAVPPTVSPAPYVKPQVKFERRGGPNGDLFMKVIGNGKAKIGFKLRVDDSLTTSGLAVRDIKIESDDGNVNLKRSITERGGGRGGSYLVGKEKEKIKGSGEFTAGKEYKVIASGGSSTSGFKTVDNTIVFDDDFRNGWDKNAGLEIDYIRPINPPKSQPPKPPKDGRNNPSDKNLDDPIGSCDDYAGIHEIVWKDIKFPASGTYTVDIQVDDNVRLEIFNKKFQAQTLDVKGFRGPGKSNGKQTFALEVQKGTYTIRAFLQQIPGKPIYAGNPMGLAINIKTAFVTVKKEITIRQSWNQNPFGAALIIKAPPPPIPIEPTVEPEGACPPNPIWTTRHPAKDQWHPVSHRAPSGRKTWSKFMNRYAMSPVLPIGTKGSGYSGNSWSNSWTTTIPFAGFYVFKGTVDNFADVTITQDPENSEVSTATTKEVKKVNGFRTEKKDLTSNKIFLEKGKATININVRNGERIKYKQVTKKVFNTKDWVTKPTDKADKIGVDFDVYGQGSKKNMGLKFVFQEKGGDHTFTIDNVGESKATETVSKRVKRNTDYKVTAIATGTHTIKNEEQRYRIELAAPGTKGRGKDAKIGGVERKKIKYLDEHGDDPNATLSIDSMSPGQTAKFSDDGSELIVKGNGEVTLKFKWDDNPRSADLAVGELRVGGKTFRQVGEKGEKRETIKVGNSSNTGSVSGASSLKNISFKFENDDARDGNRMRISKLGIDTRKPSGRKGPFDPAEVTAKVQEGEVYEVEFITENKAFLRLKNDGRKIECNDNTDNDHEDAVISISDGTFFDLVNGGENGQPQNIGKAKFRYGTKSKPTPAPEEVRLVPEQGTLKRGSFGSSRKSGAKESPNQTDVIFADIIGSANDNDDMQIRCNKGIFTPSNKRKGVKGTSGQGTQKRNTWDLTFRVDAAEETVAEPITSIGEGFGKYTVKNKVLSRSVTVGPPVGRTVNRAPVIVNPTLATYRRGSLGPFLSPFFPNGTRESGENLQGRTWEMVWENVEFPIAGEYKMEIEADDVLEVFIGENLRDSFGSEGYKSVGQTRVFKGVEVFTFALANAGKRDIKLILQNASIPGTTFQQNPTVAACKITCEVPVELADQRSWLVNPVGISAVLLAPPCKRDISGIGTVTKVFVEESGNSYTPTGGGVPSQIILTDLSIKKSGIGYTPGDLVCIEKEDGTKDCYSPVIGEFGKIIRVPVKPTPITTTPKITTTTDTGIGLIVGPPITELRIDTPEVDPETVIQVTDLAGLKQTGYIEGRPYYGEVFFKDGTPFAGRYETAGRLIQVYATLQESIDAEVTTRPSAIQRSGTDINSNNPRLNIPGTPDNLA